jgi:hypothetical protein
VEHAISRNPGKEKRRTYAACGIAAKRHGAGNFSRPALPAVRIKIAASVVFRPKIQSVLESPAFVERSMLTGRTDRDADRIH